MKPRRGFTPAAGEEKLRVGKKPFVGSGSVRVTNAIGSRWDLLPTRQGKPKENGSRS